MGNVPGSAYVRSPAATIIDYIVCVPIIYAYSAAYLRLCKDPSALDSLAPASVLLHCIWATDQLSNAIYAQFSARDFIEQDVSHSWAPMNALLLQGILVFFGAGAVFVAYIRNARISSYKRRWLIVIYTVVVFVNILLPTLMISIAFSLKITLNDDMFIILVIFWLFYVGKVQLLLLPFAVLAFCQTIPQIVSSRRGTVSIGWKGPSAFAVLFAALAGCAWTSPARMSIPHGFPHWPFADYVNWFALDWVGGAIAFGAVAVGEAHRGTRAADGIPAEEEGERESLLRRNSSQSS